MLKLKIQTMD